MKSRLRTVAGAYWRDRSSSSHIQLGFGFAYPRVSVSFARSDVFIAEMFPVGRFRGVYGTRP